MNHEITIKIPMIGQFGTGNDAVSSADASAAPPPDEIVQGSGGWREEAVAPGPDMQFPLEATLQTDNMVPGPEATMIETQASGWAPAPSASDLSGSGISNLSAETAPPPPDLDDMQTPDAVPEPDMETTPAARTREKKSAGQSRAKK
ncbi:hypothetical protein [Nitrosomonas marina]|uniref:Uncharacterized protein n=1 Tax=Nitrosomonas marina TaxID=917 RepID=A0A1H8FNF5_9PROT|nr:hypothetical protein [Nitrosomonas marina]SEN33233.1 hypothetical protein SAMN05216325_1147 [Nitrosomonas marina]